ARGPHPVPPGPRPAARVRRAPGARDEPAGPLRRGRRAPRRARPAGGLLLRQAPLRRLRRGPAARAPGSLRDLRGRRRRPAAGEGRAADALGRRRPRRRGRLDGSARPHRMRGPHRRRGRGDPGPAGPRPAPAPGRRIPRPSAHRRQPNGDRRPAHGPVRARRRRQRLPGRAALPPPRLSLPSGTGRRRRPLAADVDGSGDAHARRGAAGPDRHDPPGGQAPSPWAGAARGRPLRLPPDRPALPDLRHRDPHGGDGRAQSVLVPGLPGRL
ncbi:MAG: Endonuclease VIII, partial [uncultured Blastococcus sp.]